MGPAWARAQAKQAGLALARARSQANRVAMRIHTAEAVLLLATLGGLARAQQVDFLVDPTPFAARASTSADGRELALDNGLVRATFRLAPDAALVSLRHGSNGEELVRSVRPFGVLTLGGKAVPVGGLTGQPNHAFLLPQWLDAMQPDPAAFRFERMEQGPITERLAWQRVRHTAPDAVWPPRGVHVRFHFRGPEGMDPAVRATVHFELYDGLPLWCQWIELHNGSAAALELDAFSAVVLAAVEPESRVDAMRADVRLPELHVETDFAFHAMNGLDGSAHCVHWVPDPLYVTQVNYERKTRCLLEVRPDVGPAQTIAPGATFQTFRTWLLAQGGADPTRKALSLCRMYRTLAPWATENPLMMHVRSSDPDAVRTAVDQCAEVGFEMVILTFGSGFDIEDESPSNLARWKELRAYAASKGIELGGYSLLSSRRIQPDGDNCIDPATGKPGGTVFGNAPALASDWGQQYFRKLYRFFEHTGFDLLEHDGSYPGDVDAAARPPLQKGVADSQWVQFGIIRDFYRWCRARGTYLNVPDWYFLSGSSKTGMGYRETNWSLPREQQLLHARQNLFDGTQVKTPSMGWMFVPLTEYHGGGPAATIEPLDQHREHYGLMLASTLGWGAQACWRGPRLYDTDATRDLVKRWVGWFRQHRRILESDVVHTSSRRADGRDLDWVLHVDPRGTERAMLVAFNPTDAARTRTVRLELGHGGLGGEVRMVDAAGRESDVRVGPDGVANLDVTVAPRGVTWHTFLPGR